MSRFLLVLFIVSVGAVLASPIAAQAQGDACASADRLTEAKVLDSARAEYQKLLRTEEPPACAREGFDTVAALQRSALSAFQEAVDLETVDHEDDALDRYIDALVIDPTLTAASEGLAALLAEADATADAYAGPIALLEAGYTTEARTAAQDVAKKTGTPIPAELRSPSISFGWVWISDHAVTTLAWLAAVIPLVLIVILLGHAMVAKTKSTPQLVVNPIDDPSKDLAIGATLTVRLAAEISVEETSGPERVLKDELATTPPVSIELPEQLKFLGEVFNRLYRRKRIATAVTAHAPGAKKAGLAVAIVTDGTVTHAEEFIGQTPSAPAAADYEQLIVRAGAWAVYKIHESHSKQPLKLLGTDDWRSYRDFRLGVAAMKRGETAAAKTLFRASLTFDPRNEGSLLNLAWLDLKRRDNISRALEMLDALVGTETSPGLIHRRHASNPRWYRGMHLRAIAHLEQAAVLPGGPERSQHLDLGLCDAVALVSEMGSTLASLYVGDHPDNLIELDELQRRKLFESLRRIETPTLMLLAGAKAQRGEPGMDPGPVPHGDLTRWRWMAAVSALTSGEEVVRYTLAAGVPGVLAPSTHYNLAIYYAQTGQPETAFEHLDRRLESGPATDALTDPTLKPLLEDPEWGERARARIAEAEHAPPTPDADPVAGSWTVTIPT